MVRIQAHTIRPASPHRTAEKRCTDPTPTIEPVMVWVVLTGTPSAVAAKIAPAPAVSAQNPCTGLSLVRREPMVFTMRQPPASVPAAIAAGAQRVTPPGISLGGVK